MDIVPLTYLSHDELKEVLLNGRNHPHYAAFARVADMYIFIIRNNRNKRKLILQLGPFVSTSDKPLQCAIPYCDGAGPFIQCCPNGHFLHATCAADYTLKASTLICPLCRDDYNTIAIMNCISPMLLQRLTPFGLSEMEDTAYIHLAANEA